MACVAADVGMKRNPASLLPTHVEDCMVDEPVLTWNLSVVKSEPAESSQDVSDSGRPSAEWYHCQTCDIYFRSIVTYDPRWRTQPTQPTPVQRVWSRDT